MTRGSTNENPGAGDAGVRRHGSFGLNAFAVNSQPSISPQEAARPQHPQSGRVHDRAWWRHEAARVGSDWKDIAEAAWGSPAWKKAPCEYHADRQPNRDGDDPGFVRARRLLADDVSLERAWHEINSRRDEAGPATIETLMVSLRDGVAALSHPATLRRLSELNDAQMREVAVRVQKFKPEIAPAWTPEEVEALAILKSKLS